MRDITTRDDIYYLMECFYAKALPDETIGYFFTEVVKMDLASHLPVITDFWEMVLLGGNQYKKNAIAVHVHLNQLSAMQEKHFTRWLQLFTTTVDALFAGDHAELAKQRAHSIATVMKIKILHSSPINNRKDDHTTGTGAS
ncbi:MAG: group III truncated hemoglobin [Bacteroidota bacterium]